MEDVLEIALKSIKITGEVSCLHKPGAVRLDGYPLLVYAPSEHGPGIRTEDNGTAVETIASAACETSSYDALAERFGTTPDHISDAIRYAVAAGFASAK